ncbi:hypothetical protein BDB00DRAFT_789698 [Zychaea mexicana]|uniref:uncharacterized protein n=1 Tax=Zychaea mexicana TaxID=64656 RepID=UPI0022FEBA33|nr:uncharacterized protein BDB00DRAFT_789698 [Zychaea mexicana]KAI9491315.1 hypothetical protein BDB00DRAFT_789698 [Zychaea mexicana]
MERICYLLSRAILLGNIAVVILVFQSEFGDSSYFPRFTFRFSLISSVLNIALALAPSSRPISTFPHIRQQAVVQGTTYKKRSREIVTVAILATATNRVSPGKRSSSSNLGFCSNRGFPNTRDGLTAEPNSGGQSRGQILYNE